MTMKTAAGPRARSPALRPLRTVRRPGELVDAIRRIAFAAATGFAVVFTLAVALAGWWPR